MGKMGILNLDLSSVSWIGSYCSSGQHFVGMSASVPTQTVVIHRSREVETSPLKLFSLHVVTYPTHSNRSLFRTLFSCRYFCHWIWATELHYHLQFDSKRVQSRMHTGPGSGTIQILSLIQGVGCCSTSQNYAVTVCS